MIQVQPPVQDMVSLRPFSLVTDACRIDPQAVACILMIAAHPQRVDDLPERRATPVEVPLPEHIVPANIKGFLFRVGKSRGQPFQLKGRICLEGCRDPRHLRPIAVALRTIEVNIHTEVGGKEWRKNRRGQLSILRRKIEPGAGQPEQALPFPARARPPAEIALKVGGRRDITPLRLLGGKEVAVGAIARADQITELSLPADTFQVQALLQETRIGCTARPVRLSVFDVEHTAHLVAINGRESAVVEIDLASELRIDETQPLLLSAADKVGTKDLKIIHIDQVLIIVSTTDRIL